MSETCDCCVGVHVATPRPIVNWPGLLRLRYRMGTHGSFLASMVARLSSRDHPSLAGLNARDPDDASTALLDGWATIADILTFYQEQIANEGYLRTATSVARASSWVGSSDGRFGPVISATAFLSFTVDLDRLDPAKDPDKDRRVTIPKGTQAQNVPYPGPLPPTQVAAVALPQTFETDEDLEARALWSRLEPRRRRPAWTESTYLDTLEALYLQGILTKLKPDGRLVLDFRIRDRTRFELLPSRPTLRVTSPRSSCSRQMTASFPPRYRPSVRWRAEPWSSVNGESSMCPSSMPCGNPRRSRRGTVEPSPATPRMSSRPARPNRPGSSQRSTVASRRRSIGRSPRCPAARRP